MAAHPLRPRRGRRRAGFLKGKYPSDVGLFSGRDVEKDNEPPALLHQASKKRKRVDPGGVSALERDLQRVLPDERYVLDSQLLVTECLDSRQAPRHSRLAATLGAWAGPSQLLARVSRVSAVLPHDLHDLALAVHVDVCRKRIRVLRDEA